MSGSLLQVPCVLSFEATDVGELVRPDIECTKPYHEYYTMHHKLYCILRVILHFIIF